jgi:hypothetical protein
MGQLKYGNLKEIPLETKYRSFGDKDLANDFFVPCLSVSDRYDRVSGYYNSNYLPRIFKGIKPFVERKGKMRLVLGYLPSNEVKLFSKSNRNLYYL